MNLTINGVCELLAFGCFVAAALGIPSRVNMIGAGLAVWMFGLIVT
jgi:ABC-type Co2+ transport system permease subunit